VHRWRGVDAALAEIERGGVTLATRRKLAAKTYARTAAYDAAISEWCWRQLGEEAGAWRAFGGQLRQTLRYGENMHQKAALYAGPVQRFGVLSARQMQGKELSYNNINDTDAAFELVSEFDPKIPAVAIIKHANPCGVAMGKTVAEAYRRAFACDSVSAFGGIIAVNQTLDGPTAEAITEILTEVVIAPDADEAAMACSPRRRTSASCSPAACRIRASPASWCAPWRAGSWSRIATSAGSALRSSRSSPSANPARQRSATCCSPSPCASTSSRTRSSTPRTAPRSASGQGR